MSNYNLTQLESKDMTELKKIAAELELKVSNSVSQQQLVYDILDRQAVVNSQQKAAKEKSNPQKNRRSRVSLKKNTDQKVMTATGKKTVQADEPEKKEAVEEKKNDVVEEKKKKSITLKSKEAKKSEADQKNVQSEIPVVAESENQAKQQKKRPAKKTVKVPEKENAVTQESVELKHTPEFTKEIPVP